MKKVIVISDDKRRYRRLFDSSLFSWVLYMIGYSIVLITVSCLFKKTFYIDSKYFGLYAFLASVIIYILNQTIKPVLFYITLPITAITFGLFYPILNVFVLYITSYLLGSHFTIRGVFLPFIIAIIISVLNMFMEGMIIKPIIHKGGLRK